jgi:YegS/Rv2252/BmrU family lipid kinase
MTHFLLIANPTAGAAAGRGSRKRPLEAARLDLEKHGHTVEIVLESNPARVSEIAAQAARDHVPNVVAAGGDGTVNAVVNGLMQAAEGKPLRLPHTQLGVLPLGTGNVFAFNLRIGRNAREACRVLRAQNTRAIDVGLARQLKTHEERHFVLMAGIGFDAKVIEETSLRLKFVLRDFAYALKSLQNAVLHKGSQMTLRFGDGRKFSDMAWLVIVGNAASYAWDIRVTGRAKLDDGMVDVCLLPYENKLFSVQQAMMMLIGQHVERGTAHYWKTKSVKIEAAPEVPIQLDGDEWGRTPVEIRVLPGVLQVLAPPE